MKIVEDKLIMHTLVDYDCIQFCSGNYDPKASMDLLTFMV